MNDASNGNIFVNKQPFITALIVTRNEEKYIYSSLMSLIQQDYPKELYEIIVVDGESDDRTVEIVNGIISKTYLPEIRLITNFKRILASGWNIGIKQSKGEFVVRIDAHAEANHDFISKSVETIINFSDVSCVGGKLITRPMGNESYIVSAILSSPFGVGNSSFRVSNISEYTDTAVYGLYRKSIFKKVGYFNEKYVRNQDIELHGRIRAAGGKFYFNPNIRCVYYSRNTVGKMLKQAYGNGAWNMVLVKNNPSCLSLRHIVPLMFVIFIIVTTLIGILDNIFWKIEGGVLCLHLALGFIASCKTARNITEVLCMPFLFMLLHIVYGLGFFKGLFINIKEK